MLRKKATGSVKSSKLGFSYLKHAHLHCVKNGASGSFVHSNQDTATLAGFLCGNTHKMRFYRFCKGCFSILCANEHFIDRMRIQASVKIDRKIGGTDTEMPEAPDGPKVTQTREVEENFEPHEPKIRKSGTGCVYQVNDTLWEGSFYPRLPNGKRKKFNVYAKTRKECEKLLTEMITKKKAEIAEIKKQMKTA